MNLITGTLARAPGPTLAPQLALAVAGLGAVVALALLQPALPAGALLPATATGLFTLAAIAAALAWIEGGNGAARHLTCRDIAGLFTFAGICVAAAIDPDELVRLLASRSGGE